MLSSNANMSAVNGSEQSLKYHKLSYFIQSVMPYCIYSEKVSQEITHHVVFCKLYDCHRFGVVRSCKTTDRLRY